MRALKGSLYQDFDGENYRLAGSIGSGATTITLKKSPYGIWREPGFALLYNRDEQLHELVEYQTIGGTGAKDLQTCTRRKYGVGDASFTFPASGTDVWHVWLKRGNPLDVMVEWMLSTDTPGANGSHDVGRDGLGGEIAQSYVDVAGIETIRDEYFPVPVFSGDIWVSGSAVLFVEKEPIDNLGEWISRHILLPRALLPLRKADERFSIDLRFRVPASTKVIGDDWMKREFDASKWERGYEKKINDLRLSSDWSVGGGEFGFSESRSDADSIASYGRAQLRELEGRGDRSGRLGFPDYSGLSDLRVGATRILLDCGNPWSEIEAETFYRHKDLDLLTNVALNVPALPDLKTGARGLAGGLFVVDGRDVDHAKGRVKLQLRQRRTLYRPAFIAPDTVASDYDQASEADRQYCYVTPNDAATFPNGDEAYKVLP
jgi:hypothetical protein